MSHVFFRSKDDKKDYYSADPKVELTDGRTVVSWTLKKIGKDDKLVISTKDLANKYEPCSPYEALGSTLI